MAAPDMRACAAAAASRCGARGHRPGRPTSAPTARPPPPRRGDEEKQGGGRGGGQRKGGGLRVRTRALGLGPLGQGRVAAQGERTGRWEGGEDRGRVGW